MSDIAGETVVDGRYRVMSRLGSGGMADVYCAEDLQLGRRVALKTLHGRFAEDQEFVERFRREASSAAGLQHPNVVAVYDRGEWEGTYYIAMEYLEGEPLKALVQREAPLSPDRAINLTIQILRAARFAHRRGIIHRDFKPHNVIVDPEGRAKVTDFGIARAGASDMTETGSIMGTAQYLSPEQAQGHAVSAQSDLYAIGIVLYEMLTGRVPFDGDTAVSVALKQVSEDPVPPSHLNPAVSPALELVVLRALAKDPAHRFSDADEFIAALEAAQSDVVVPGPATTAFAAVPVEPEEERGRRWWPWALLAALLLGLAVLAAVVLLDSEKKVVPRVTGYSLAAAQQRLLNDGFEVSTERVTSNRPRDEVINQDPDPGTELVVGDEVRLTVSDGPGTRAVPTVDGLTRAEAVRRLRRERFKPRVRTQPSDEVPKGRVIRTTPSGGAEARVGATVTVFVSGGPERVAVPPVVGQDEDSARAEIERAGLTAAVQRRESEDQDPGTVLSQTPAANSRVEEGSTVTITVAKEPAEERVPDVEGADEDDATRRLEAAGFQVNVEEEAVDSPSEDGEVLSQSPAGGREVRRGSTVTITVGRFDPDLDPEPEPEPPPDEPPAGEGDGGGAASP
jgi:serine/threonine-protein kinase